MCQGLGLSKHDVAVRISEATGRGFENVLLDLARVPSSPFGVDTGRISERTFGQYARSQGISDWDAAGLVSNMTGMGIEAAHHKLTIREVADLPQLNPRQSFRPFPFSSSSLPHGSVADLPIGSLAPIGSRHTGSDLPRVDWPESVRGGDNAALLAKVNDSNQPEAMRLSALDDLIENGAVDELYAIVNNSNRYDSWRVKALDALCDLACRSGMAMEYLNLIVNNSDRYDSWRITALDRLVDLAHGSTEAAAYLFALVNNTNRYDSWRLKALRGLIHGGHREYLRQIASNSNRYDSWRREAREAMGE